MRGIFFDLLKVEMKKNDKIFFLSGDTGFNLIEPLYEIDPKRFINVGVAEQNLIGIAAGLCNAGYTPVCYAITNFIVHRCLEQLRDDICLHKYKIVLAGTSTGFDNGGLGGTHHMLDDIGCLKPLPNINIYSPSGQKSMSSIFSEAFAQETASFIRITKGDYVEATEVKGPNHFIHQAESDLLVIAHGKMVKYCADAWSQSPDFSLYALDRIKPLDDEALKQLLGKYNKIVVVEDNFSSGLFNSLSQWAIEHRVQTPSFHFIGPGEAYEIRIGDSNFLEDKHGLSPKKLAAQFNVIKRGDYINV